MMGHDKYGMPSSSSSPTLRRRQNFPTPTRFVKYALFVAFFLLTIALWKRQDLPPTVSQYLPGTLDSIDVEAQENPLPPSPTPPAEEDLDPTQPVPPLDFKNTPPEAKSSDGVTKPKYPRFGKITATFGEPDPPYENAIASHNLHNEIHGYPHFILRERILRGLWSKHAWMMNVIGQELAKPEDQRLQWVMWHDRDTVLMNPQLPLDVFVPPEPEFKDIHMLVTNDRNGLNNGVFLCRVSQWSFKFFASALSIREYQPEIELKYTEQSGMEEVIKRQWWGTGVAFVPQRWFNGFPPSDKDLANGKPSASRPGSLLIHFASNRDGLRPERMEHWGQVAKNRTAEWDKPTNKTGYLSEVKEYWERVGKGEKQEDIIADIGHRIWD